MEERFGFVRQAVASSECYVNNTRAAASVYGLDETTGRRPKGKRWRASAMRVCVCERVRICFLEDA